MVLKRNLIIDNSLSGKVDFLMEKGLQSPKAIARELNRDPEVHTLIHPAKVLPSDIRKYLETKRAQKDKALERSLAHSAEGRELVEQVRERVAWLVEHTELLSPLLSEIEGDFRIAQERWRNLMAEDDGGLVPYPERQLRALKSTVDTVAGILKLVRGDGQLSQILKANNVTVNTGMGRDEVFDLVFRVGLAMTCPSCGHRGFTRDDVSAAFARAQADRTRDAAIDANVIPK